MIVFFDSVTLGILSSPSEKLDPKECQDWLYELLARSAYLISPSLCNYEVRRSLILTSMVKNKRQGSSKLDSLHQIIDFLPVSQYIIKKAAQLWAETRSKGQPTADIKNIDVDVIIGATYQLLQSEYPGQFIVVATTNVKHISRFTEAKNWQDIQF
ncbi:MAG: type II toxin-antitoxin system VapC family toxin [Moorea sp. SIO2B7]|nr:type II toxin-antitoxin system VapC family toxin [Moorena sp. SIO2B7]